MHTISLSTKQANEKSTYLYHFYTSIDIQNFDLPPPWFDPKHPDMSKLDNEQIGWWDERHIKQQEGKVGNNMVQYSFKRDENGKLSQTCEHTQEVLTKTSFKYPKQGRFLFSVAKV